MTSSISLDQSIKVALIFKRAAPKRLPPPSQIWTPSFKRNLERRLRDLVGLPMAEPFEAPNSWVSRAAAHQGCSLSEFMRYLGYNGVPDFDYTLFIAFHRGLPDMPELHGVELGHQLVKPFRKFSGFRSSSPKTRAHKGRYGFCPICIAEMPTPHVPLYWRFRDLPFCTRHLCLLEDSCPHCKAPLRLPSDMLNAGVRRSGVADLGHCQLCARPMQGPAIPLRAGVLTAVPSWAWRWVKEGPGNLDGHGLCDEEQLRQRKQLAVLRDPAFQDQFDLIDRLTAAGKPVELALERVALQMRLNKALR